MALTTLSQHLSQLANSPKPSASPASSPASEWVNPFTLFDTSVHPDAARAHSAVKEWAYATSRKEHSGLVLWSSGYGAGKTHLARCAFEFLREVADIDGDSQKVEFIASDALFRDIRDLYAMDKPEGPYLDGLTRGTLIIDDFGKEYVKAESLPWMREKFFYLFNRIYPRRSFLMTSNSTPEAIENAVGAASWSRLLGMCGPRGFIDMSAVPDYRLAKAGF